VIGGEQKLRQTPVPEALENLPNPPMIAVMR
jgi:hypothetical protein